MIEWPSRTLVVLSLVIFAEAFKEKCDKCVAANSCSFYGNMNTEQQARWVERFECPKGNKENLGTLFGFAPTAKGDMVCCSDSIWGTNVNDGGQGTRGQNNFGYNAQYNAQPDYKRPNQGDGTFNNNKPIDNGYRNQPNNFNANGYDSGINSPSNNNYDPNYHPQYSPNQRHPVRQPNNQGNWAPRPTGNQWNRNPDVGGNQWSQNGNAFGGNDNSFGRHNGLGGNRNTFGRNGNGIGGSNFGNQCPVTVSPPNPESGCCGREASDSDRITVRQPWASRNQRRPWRSPTDDFGFMRMKRAAAVNVTVGNRIAVLVAIVSFDGTYFATQTTKIEPQKLNIHENFLPKLGGKETELEQFPWTVLLKTTFDYGTSEASFNCGGSLISSYYVLTAGHCVVDTGARVKNIEINLAEYDKRTFPRDCKNVLGEGQKCVENIVMHSQSFMPHPNYDNDRLYNDIALIRLREPAPYTDYIRPICLPPINVDDPDLFNLRLAVAGWGRNGKYKSDIKQSTVVNLVPNRECSRYYPNLSKSQLCAAGYSGEDTCKGDSGGPLMLQYEGKYFVSGVVSGKRADAPCGTSVPSLYTNVYYHLDWIRNNIRN